MFQKFDRAGRLEKNMMLKGDVGVDFRPNLTPPPCQLPAGLSTEIIRELGTERFNETKNTGGMNFKTTLDFTLQAQLQHMITEGVKNLAPHVAPGREAHLEAAFIVLEAKTGHVLACISSRDSASQFSCATQAMRQLASNIKPFIAAVAFDNGLSPSEMQSDTPIPPGQIRGAPNIPNWPQNSDAKYSGAIDVFTALAKSRNPPFVRIANRYFEPLNSFMGATHLGKLNRNRPAEFLGTTSATLKNVAGAYGVLANDGLYVSPHLLLQAQIESRRVMQSQSAILVRSAMRQAVQNGTAMGLKPLPGGAKTATSSGEDGCACDLRVSYVEEQLVATFWIGLERGNLAKSASSRDICALSRKLIETSRHAPSVAALVRKPAVFASK
jgi:membrane peptidoglycan carboxypeptidase